ncbi:rhamnogalacturonan acetylesterase [Nibricoccus aquaticus]|uniref:Rhamnogalacturonan acetylesterase n=1 Tax=Nibricoccus aquaticus TaxID=2576891 RepID=A0A290QJF5_9BACT|nr:rhamnogalacturonan acetylesterase [Nibricoccus aquaticus]ATC64461.1 rhamnogalacturonan acetylesterase [Nibricoccus aquaticus]
MKKLPCFAGCLVLPALLVAQDLSFMLGTEKAYGGWQAVPAEIIYSSERGYGFEPGGEVRKGDPLVAPFVQSVRPFYFSVAVPEGNYRVVICFAETASSHEYTVKAELRRLMVEKLVAGGESGCVRNAAEFVVNVRRAQIAGGGEVRLKPRERAEEAWAWDEKLTLEFNGPHPTASYVMIKRMDDVPTVFLLGDSTVADQPREPFASWGQMITRFFAPTVAIANHSESGESLASALSERRVEKILSIVRPGDWVLLQFGHNDMKKDSVETYTANLKKVTAALAAKNARVVLVTQMHRHSFGPDGKIQNSHKDYPDAVRTVAREENLPLIDLHAMSQVLYESLGAEKALLAFKAGDATHHNPYGAYELAKCVVEGVRQQVPELAKHIITDLPRFDPAKPDAPETFSLPPSPTVVAAKPDGS